MDPLFDAITWDRDGAGIEAESFRRIEAEVDPAMRARFSDAEWRVARRLVHATADFSILPELEFSGNPCAAGRAALRRGALIYTDSNMIRAGLSVPKLKKFHPGYEREAILCPVAEPEVAAYARERGVTRALAAVERCADRLEGCIFLCGNAPLALAGVIRLGVAPALIVGMPVGFVNVVESKKLLDLVTVPFVRINGRRGGSPLAVATLHAMMEGDLP